MVPIELRHTEISHYLLRSIAFSVILVSFIGDNEATAMNCNEISTLFCLRRFN